MLSRAPALNDRRPSRRPFATERLPHHTLVGDIVATSRRHIELARAQMRVHLATRPHGTAAHQWRRRLHQLTGGGVVAQEWVMTDDGGWQPIDPLAEMTAIAAAVREHSDRNRAVIDASRALCTAIRERVQQQARMRRAWSSLPLAGATRH